MSKKLSKRKSSNQLKKKKLTETNEVINSVSHLIATCLSVAGLVLMVVFAALHSTAWHVVGFSIFGASLILLYISSTLYHFFSPESKAKKVFHRIDHAMIYVLIAGTYTAICLTVMRGPWGWTIFGIIWAIAIVGIVIKSVGIGLQHKISTVMYVIMGWLIVIPLVPLVKSLPFMALFWLVLGGISYTIGALLQSLDDKIPRTRWFGMHEVFHLLVMFGSFCHFWLMFRYVLYL